MTDLEIKLRAIKEEKDTKIIPENIRAGVQIFDVVGSNTGEGLDTSDGTVTAEDIPEGKIAYSNGKRIVGTLKWIDPAYQRVEYIEGTGTQFINTGVNPIAGNTAAEIDFQMTSVMNGEQWAIGQWYKEGWRCGGTTGVFDTTRGFTYSSTNFLDRITAVSTGSTITAPYPMFLFCQQENGTAKYLKNGYMKIYRCKIWENGVLIRDFIPCYRKSDKYAGMYDCVNYKFYGNAGSGGFIVGPEYAPYIRLEYIESTDATQYIDTGVKALSSVGAELTVQTREPKSAAFFGAYQDGGLLFGQHNGYSNPEEKGYYIATAGIWTYSGVAFDHTVFHKFVYDPINNIITVDGTSVAVDKNPGKEVNLWIFRGYEWGENMSGVRISSCKIYNNGKLIRDYIPVRRKFDYAVCMYDLVNKEYAMPSSGTFIAGPEI